MSPPKGFGPVLEIVRLLSDFQRPWMIAGGWAIDLFFGRVTRDHDDVDVAIYRADQQAIRRHLPGWEFDRIVEGRREPWRVGEWLEPPVHEVHAYPADGEPREMEILLNETLGAKWVFRRDVRITRPLSQVRRLTRSRVPFLAPEIVLLYKAKDPKPKDRADFEAVRPRLRSTHRRWLREALETAYPSHPWIARL
jgi:Aminoglycoside-2''-adenylyltransferase